MTHTELRNVEIWHGSCIRKYGTDIAQVLTFPQSSLVHNKNLLDW